MSETFDRAPDERRGELLEAMLAHVPFDGWTDKALVRGADDLGLDAAFVKLVFPGGPMEALEYWMDRADAAMVDELARRGVRDMRIRDRIATAVRVRLEQAAPHREAVRRAAGILALPQNTELAATGLWRTADAMWRAAGDTSTDYNYYTKRAILSGVYSSTLLAWMADDSEGFAETWAFLDRRIENVMQFEKVKGRLLKERESWPSLTRFLGRLRYPAR